MRILIIDDDEIGRGILETVLKKFGYDVHGAEDGAAAIEILGANEYPIVICDWEMPGVTGLDVCRWIRSNPSGRSCYIIMLTARAGFADTIEGIDSGADCFLSKPCDSQLILDHIRTGQRILEGERRDASRRAAHAC